MAEKEPRHNVEGGESPPIGRSWAVLYAVVIGNLALCIVLFWAFTQVFK